MTRPLIVVAILAALVGGLVGAVVARGAGAPQAPATPAVSGKTYQEMVDQQMARSRPAAPERPRTWTPPRIPPERAWRNEGLFQESEAFKRYEMERRIQRLEDRAQCAREGFRPFSCP